MTRITDYTLFSRYRLGSVISKPILPCAKVSSTFLKVAGYGAEPHVLSPINFNLLFPKHDAQGFVFGFGEVDGVLGSA